ncbi:hypothetical protein HHI36_001945, partial [Cryptolaemus montrouzieri]
NGRVFYGDSGSGRATKSLSKTYCLSANTHGSIPTVKIQYFTSSFLIMNPRAYQDRHNTIARICYQANAIQLRLPNFLLKCFQYQPYNLMQNDDFKLYWDIKMETVSELLSAFILSFAIT